jgi:hypothetical protein
MDFLESLQNIVYNNIKKTTLINYITDLEGYKPSNFEEVFTNILLNFENTIIIEIGSFKGLISSTMATICKSNNKSTKILCIENWLNNTNDLNPRNGFTINYYIFLNNIYYLNHHDIIIPFPMSSINAYQVFNNYNFKCDIIYLNSSSIIHNINIYVNLLNNNGILFGPNYDDLYIKNIIDEFLYNNPLFTLNIINDMWILNKFN